MRRGNYQGPRRVVVDAARQMEDWEGFDLRNDHYYDPDNGYTSGPGLHLPTEHLPYTLRTTGVPFKLFVCGIHHYTTEEGIRHVFSNCGCPLSVTRTRNRLNQPIAFVEFQTQAEADYAIMELNGKPPLYWEVSYAMTRKTDERVLYQQLANIAIETELEFERQTPLGPVPNVGRQIPHAMPSTGFSNTDPSMGAIPRPTSAFRAVHSTTFPACAVCGESAANTCTICKTRYCSVECQSRDWPTHRNICIPPPPLEPANDNLNGPRHQQNGPRASVNGYGSRGGQDLQLALRNQGTSLAPRQSRDGESFRHQEQNGATSAKLTSPHSYLIKGIHPLDQQTRVSEQEQPSVTFHRTINSEPKLNATSPEKKTIKADDSARLQEISRPNSRTNSQVNGQAHSSQTTGRSPNWQSNGTPPLNNNYTSNGPPPQTNSTVANGRQNQNIQGRETGARPRNYPLSRYSPTTPIASPPKKPQQTQISTVRVYAKEFTSRELKPLTDNPIQISVCFAKSPHDFYIQYYCFQEALTKLMISIKNSALQSDPMVNPIEGMPCLAVFAADRDWYRAQVLKVLPDGVGVRFVDFGNTQKMPNNPGSFRMMEQSLSESPFYAIKVKLADVLPVDGDTWSIEVKNKFNDMTTNQIFFMERVGVDGDALCVRLKDSDGTDLALRLVQENMAKRAVIEVSDELDPFPSTNGHTAPQPPKVVPRQQVSAQIPNKSCAYEVARPSSLQNGGLHQAVATSVIQALKESPKASLSLPPQSPVPIVSPTRAAVRQTPTVQPRAPLPTVASAIRATTPVPISAPTAHSPTPVAYNNKVNSIIEDLKLGASTVFTVTVLLNCGGLAGTLIRDKEDLKVMDFDTVARTMETLPNYNPPVGSIVAAFSPEHEQWFRACIAKVLDSSFSVLYIDYGNFEDVVSVKPIPANYQGVELAVKLTLAGNVTTEAKKYVEEEMYLGSTHPLNIVSEEQGGSAVANITTENGLTIAVALSSWTALKVQPEVPVPSKAASVPVRDIPSLQWEPGFSCDVMVYVAEHIDCIYVQPVANETLELIAAIQQKLNDSFPTSSKFVTPPLVGSCVAALFPDDNEVYRARITEINGESITLFYVDYGNTSVVSLADIRALPDDLYEHPTMCKRVALARLAHPVGPLSNTVKDLLSTWINQISNMMILQSSSGLTECVLNKDGEVLNKLVSDLFEKTNNENAPREMPALEPASASESVSPAKEEIPGDNTLGEYSYENGPFEELPEQGDFQAVFLYTSGGPQVIMLRIHNDKLSAKLAQLEEEMAIYAESISRGHSPKMNEICIARYADGKWYRSACVDITEDVGGSVYSCVQVDCGNIQIIDVDSVRRIPKRFVEFLPFQAHQAILEGTETIEVIQPELATRVFEILPANCVRTVSVVGRFDIAFIVRIPEVSDILVKESLL